MSNRELRNLQTSLQTPEFAEPTARGQRAAAREQTKGRTEPEMEESKLPAVEPKGDSHVKPFNFENRELFVIKNKATNEELAKLDSVSLISYLLDL